MSTATANGDAGLKGAAPTGKQQFKPAAGGKALDGARKQAGSPVDGQNRKQTPTPQRAWTGTNPITQRPTNSPSLANGSDKSQQRSSTQPQHKGNGDLPADKQASDRLLYLLAHCTGNDATLTLKNGEQFTGVFSGSSLESSAKSVYILKMVKKTKLASHQQVNGNTESSDEYIGEGEDHVMVFDAHDTADLAVANVVTANAHATPNGSTTSSFRTDTEISRDARMPRERELKKWDGGMGESLEDMSLESTSKHGGWDQFAVNEQNFGTRTTYNEDDYTTSIDRNNPEYRRRAAEAERIAREIERSAPANAHVREERQQNASQDDGMDEEEKYSGVRRENTMAPLAKGGAGSYVPPSRRPITSQPTISGAPFDPAIISLSKPVAAPAAPPAAPAAAAAAMPEKAAEAVKPVETPAKVEDAQPTTSENTENPTTAPSATQPPKKTGNTTEDHLRGTADAFKQFANNEKLRLRAAQEAKRSNARHEKNIKLNDLKKFAENFRLKSRVPDDLVPILAKDHDKQLEIKRKAEESARFDEQKRRDSEKSVASQTPPKSTSSQAATPTDSRAQTQQSQSQSRNRVSQNVRGGMQIPSPRAALSQRHNLPSMHQARGGIAPPQPLPSDLRIPSGPVSTREGETLSPTAANNARLNVNAKEFKFTPGASSFTPTGASPSPQRMPVAAPIEEPRASFFDVVGKKSSETKKDVNTDCDTIKRMRETEYPVEWKKSIAENAGIPQPFRTGPTWTVPAERVNTKYLSAFPEPRSLSQGPSPMHTPNPANGPMPHAHQLPPHLQAPHLPNPGQQQRFPHMPQYAPQYGHAQNFDPRMPFAGGPGNSVQNSPRYQQAQMAGFNGQMGQMPMGGMPQFPNQPMQNYGMSPSMAHRQMQNPGAPQMMMPPYQQMNQMRPNFAPGPGFGGPNMPQMGGGAPMMTQNPSSSGFMPPQYQGNSPMPPHAQPQMPHMPQQGAGPNGYAGSPRPGPHMMQASGSHQGFAPHMQQQHSQQGPPFAPPFHGQQQQPQHQGQRHTSTGGYPQMTPRSQQAMPAQQGHVPSPGMGGPVAGHGDK